MEWKESKAQLQEQIGALESDKARLEAQTSQLSSQLHETQSNLEQQERSSKQGANKVSRQNSMRHAMIVQVWMEAFTFIRVCVDSSQTVLEHHINFMYYT